MNNKHLLVAVVCFLTCSPRASDLAAFQDQAGVDLFTPGVTIRGSSTFEKTKHNGADATLFFIREAETFAIVRLMSQYLSNADLVTSKTYRKLLPSGSVTLRLAEVQPVEVVPGGTRLNPQLLDGIMMCQPEPNKRDEKSITYILQCINADTDRWAQIDNHPVWEVAMSVTTPNQSVVDQFIGRFGPASDEKHKFIYVRFER